MAIAVQTEVAKGTITQLHLKSPSPSQSHHSLFVGLEDGSLCMYDLRTLQSMVRDGDGETDTAIATAQLPDKDSVTLPVEEGKYINIYDSEKEPLMAMDISLDGNTILTGGAGTTITKVGESHDRASTITAATTSAKNEDVKEDDIDIDIEKLSFPFERDTDANRKVHKTTIPIAGTSSIKIRGDNRIAITSHWDGTTRIYDMKKKMKPLAVLSYHRESVFAIAFNQSNAIANVAENGIFATASKDTTIAIWSVYSNTYKRRAASME